jgi:GlpG protein
MVFSQGKTKVTIFFVVACIIAFAWGELRLSAGPWNDVAPYNHSRAFMAYSPISRALMYDMPSYSRGYWRGAYYETLKAHYFGFDEDALSQVPKFERIRSGEYWRLFTPCLLHGSIFHIAVNMMWLYVFGKQMERRLGIWKYLFFILFVGIVSNTAQYLMGGFPFVGFSGVVTGMLMFVFNRKLRAPREGYDLHSSTAKVLIGFVLIMALVQAFSFALQMMGQSPLNIGIANTAHVVGGIVGGLLAYIGPYASQRR